MDILDRIAWAAVALILAVGCAATPPPSDTQYALIDSDQLLINRNSLPYFWPPSAFPLEVTIDGRLPAKYVKGTIAGVGIWNEAVGTELLTWRVSTEAGLRDTRAPLGITVVSFDIGVTEDNVRKLGMAQPRIRASGEIVRMVIVLDEDLEQYYVVPVVVHEIGHALGLRHDPDRDSIMYKHIIRRTCQGIMPEDADAVRIQARQVLSRDQTAHQVSR